MNQFVSIPSNNGAIVVNLAKVTGIGAISEYSSGTRSDFEIYLGEGPFKRDGNPFTVVSSSTQDAKKKINDLVDKLNRFHKKEEKEKDNESQQEVEMRDAIGDLETS